MAAYTYSISGDTSNGTLCPCQLLNQVKDSSMSTAAKNALLSVLVDPASNDPDRLDVDFGEYTLLTADETALDGVVGAHAACDESYQVHRVSGFVDEASTNSKICRWSSVAVCKGSKIAYTDDADDGGYWTVQEDGIYSVTVWAQSGSSSTDMYIAVDSALNNTYADSRCRARATWDGSDKFKTFGFEGFVAAGSKIWVAKTATYGLENASSGGVEVVKTG